jgi:hypothetical protein
MAIDDTPLDWLEASGVSGVFARVDNNSIRRLRTLSVPVVDVRCRLVSSADNAIRLWRFVLSAGECPAHRSR